MNRPAEIAPDATALPRRPILPGFGLTLGYSTAYLGFVVLLPLAALVLRSAQLSPHEWLALLAAPRTLAALRLTVCASVAAAVANGVFGTLVAWVLTRYRFPGKGLLDALVDLPFALPTAVAGIALTTLYAPGGWLGRLLAPLGVQVAFTPLGVIVALSFISLPFVVRTIQPVLADLDADLERAAETLGAHPVTVFWRVVLPVLLPALLTGCGLAFSRALGEYGSVIFIAGNIPLVSEVMSLLIMGRIEQFQHREAAALAVLMLVISFAFMFLLNAAQLALHRRQQGRR